MIFMNLSGLPISTMIIIEAKMMAETAIISAILVSGVLQWTLTSLRMAVIRDPTRLMATKNTKLEI
jgi:hypothetical protein